jgi:hypothetical protein
MNSLLINIKMPFSCKDKDSSIILSEAFQKQDFSCILKISAIKMLPKEPLNALLKGVIIRTIGGLK